VTVVTNIPNVTPPVVSFGIRRWMLSTSNASPSSSENEAPGAAVGISDPIGGTWQLDYDVAGQPIWETSPFSIDREVAHDVPYDRKALMSTWLYVAIGGVLLWIVARITIGNVDSSAFQQGLRRLAGSMRNGSAVEIYHRGSRAFVRVRRCGEEPRGVVLRVEVPRASWSEPYAAEITAAAEGLGVEPIDLSEQPAVLLAFDTYAPAVRDYAAGTHAARLAQAVFAALGVPKEARYRMRLEGDPSSRVWRPRADEWAKSSSPVTRWLGRRIIAAHDKEVGATTDRKNT